MSAGILWACREWIVRRSESNVDFLLWRLRTIRPLGGVPWHPLSPDFTAFTPAYLPPMPLVALARLQMLIWPRRGRIRR
jgi:hypothetical protein